MNTQPKHGFGWHGQRLPVDKIKRKRNCDMTVHTGKVYIVGAGPGDPDLITVRGIKSLQQASVVLYDRLVNPQLLNEVHAGAQIIYVGKTPGEHTYAQKDINLMLVALARLGHTVVRLKGGDPFIFGRGGEEALALAQAGIPFEIVPGISSALAVPTYAGIPLTHRGIARSFTIITGHTFGNEDCAINWQALPADGTLVILMGVRNLPRIAAALLAHGCPADTPAAVIANGTTTRQQTVTGTLATIAARARNIPSPAIIVVGEVVALHRQLAWVTPTEQHTVSEVEIFEETLIAT